MRRIFFALLLSIAWLDAHAQSSPNENREGVTIISFNCGDWVTQRQEGPAQSIKLRGYVVGYINGLAIGRGADLWRANGGVLSQDQVFLWIDNWCKENPLETLDRAIFQFARLRSEKYSEFK